jgi:hypothetical protein
MGAYRLSYFYSGLIVVSSPGVAPIFYFWAGLKSAPGANQKKDGPGYKCTGFGLIFKNTKNRSC